MTFHTSGCENGLFVYMATFSFYYGTCSCQKQDSNILKGRTERLRWADNKNLWKQQVVTLTFELFCENKFVFRVSVNSNILTRNSSILFSGNLLLEKVNVNVFGRFLHAQGVKCKWQ